MNFDNNHEIEIVVLQEWLIKFQEYPKVEKSKLIKRVLDEVKKLLEKYLINLKI